MKITYASHHRWEKPVLEDPIIGFSKSVQTKLRTTLNKISDFDIVSEFKPLDENFFSWFMPMYECSVSKKTNPIISNVKEKTQDTLEKSYRSLGLYENGRPVGGVIFSITDTALSFAYRIFNNDWYTTKLRANPSTYAEYLVARFAAESGCMIIKHGKDRNPYGLNASIGLAGFKLSAGCKPIKSEKFEIEELDTDTLSSDALILEYPGESESCISKAYLVTTRESELKWSYVSKYPELLKVEVLHRN